MKENIENHGKPRKNSEEDKNRKYPHASMKC